MEHLTPGPVFSIVQIQKQIVPHLQNANIAPTNDSIMHVHHIKYYMNESIDSIHNFQYFHKISLCSQFMYQAIHTVNTQLNALNIKLQLLC